MLRGKIAATLLKNLWKNLYSVNCYDELNTNVLTLIIWENFRWGLIYFDQFILRGLILLAAACSAFFTLCMLHIFYVVHSAHIFYPAT